MWFGVCERAIKSGKKEAIEKVCCLWSDVDSGEQTWTDFEYQPHIVVRSGNGHHLYWLIEPIRITSKEEVEKVEGIMRGISEKIKGDNTSDVTRILRIPETYNNKDPNNPKKVEIIEYNFDIERYKITDFEKFYKEKPTVIKDGIVIVDNIPYVDIKQYNLPYWVEDAIINGYDPAKHQKYKSRSELDLAVMIALVKAHFSDEMIYSVFLNPNYKISYKTLEKGRHYNSYLETTLKKAKEVRDKRLREWIEKLKKLKNFQGIIDVYKKWFYIEDEDYLRVIHAAIIAHKFESIPVWLILLTPPSGAKTSILQDLSCLKSYNIRIISELTPKTFVSGDKNYHGLLDEMKNGIVIFKDFTSILQFDSESRSAVFQQMREIWDGYYMKLFGTGKKVEWSGKITIIAGCTEVFEKFREIDAIMGERFLIYHHTITDRKKLADKSLQQIGKQNQMHKEIQEALQIFHDSIEIKGSDVDEVVLYDTYKEKIIILSDLVTKLRTGVKRDHKGEIEYVPDTELPARLCQQIFTFVKALAMVNGRSEVTAEEFEIIKKVSLMSIPSIKYKILKYFITNQNFTKKTTEVADELKITRSMAYRCLEELWCFGVLERDGSDESSFKWFINNELYKQLFEINF
jgi:predicted transcriptional regulator